MKALHMVAFALIVIGGLNWGIYGATNMHTNLVHSIIGSMPTLEMIVYVLVGLAAVLEAVTHGKNCRHCASKPMQPNM